MTARPTHPQHDLDEQADMDPQLKPFDEHSFPRSPELECDIVMKGGITSGVVYPHAVCELARTYRLRAVGGASAGAIAAAAAAAAEMGRQTGATGPGGGFPGLAKFPEELTEQQADRQSLLFHLFRPQPDARRLFAMVTGTIAASRQLPSPSTPTTIAALVGRLLVRSLRAYPVHAAIGAAPGVLVEVSARVAAGTAASAKGGRPGLASHALTLSSLVIGGALAASGAAAGVLTGLVQDLSRLPRLSFGMSSGMGEKPSDLALTPWLHGRLQTLAGRLERDAPLTFGDLADHDLELKVMTTNLSRAEPLAMPWADHTFWFKEEEMAALFPPRVVCAMIDSPAPLDGDSDDERRASEVHRRHALELGYRPFPDAAGLPIIVATRMSLSFPFLISAVPLYAVDFTEEANQSYVAAVDQWRARNPAGTFEEHVAGVGERPTFAVNWFSDGGLTNNLPVNFFDSPLPSRPTFAIDLAPFDQRRKSADESDNSEMASVDSINSGGLTRRTAHWRGGGLRLLGTFAAALFDTARSWVDEGQLVLPGYRDRIVTVYQDDSEGGLNLSMDAPTVAHLSERGQWAAVKLVDRFTDPMPTSVWTGWDNHRWIRLRTATASLDDWLTTFVDRYDQAGAPYQQMLQGPSHQPSYHLDHASSSAVAGRLTTLSTQVRQWATSRPGAFTQDVPRPLVRLRIMAADPKPPTRNPAPSPPPARGTSPAQQRPRAPQPPGSAGGRSSGGSAAAPPPAGA